MSILSEDLLARFRAHVALPPARAVRLLRAIAAQRPERRVEQWREQVEGAGPRVARALALYVSLLRIGETPAMLLLGGKSLSEALLHRMHNDLTAARQTVDPYYGERAALGAALSAFTSDYISLASVEAPMLFGRVLLSRLAEARENFRREDERHELAELEGRVMGQLAICCRQAFDYGEALAWYTRAAALTKSCGLEEAYGGYQLSRADILKRSGREGAEALRLILPLWEGQKEMQSGLSGPELTQLLASIYLEIGDRFEARKYLNRAAEALDRLGYAHSHSQSLDAVLSGWLSRIVEGVQGNDSEVLYQRVMKGLELNMRQHHLSLLIDGVDQEQLIQQYEAAIQEVSEAAAAQQADDYALLSAVGMAQDISPAGSAPVDSAADPPPAALHWELGGAAVEAGDLKTAHDHFERAYTLGEAAPDDTVALESLRLLLAHREKEDHAGRLAISLRGIRLIEAVRETLHTPYQRAAYLADKEAFYSVGLFSCWKMGDIDQLLRIGELVKARHLKDGRSAPHSSDRVEAMRSISDRLGGANLVERPTLLEERQRLYDQHLLARPALTLQWETLPETFSQAIRAALPPRAGVLSYYNLFDRALLIVVLTAGGETVIRQLTDSPEHFALLKAAPIYFPHPAPDAVRSPRYVPGIDVPAALEEIDWEKLADWLLPAAVRELIAPLDQLYFSPHRQLHRLPFHALRIGERYLIETHTVSYLPNLGVMLRPPGTWRRGGVAAIAAASYLVRQEVTLPPIAGTEIEARQIVEAYRAAGLPAHCLLGADCNRESLLQLLDHYAAQETWPAVLHLAVHGEDLPGDTPLDARLFLHEGSLDGFDLVNRRLPFELVVLSSCFAGSRATAGRELDYVPGDDLFGFQAAFFAAGTRRVLGALWAVDDQVGKDLMVTFYQHLLKTTPPGEALAQSMRTYLARAAGAQRDPRLWAPFFLTEMR